MRLGISPQHKGRAIFSCRRCGTTFLDWSCKERMYCSLRCFWEDRRRTNDERFDRYVHKTMSCWLWTGYKTEDGHGRFTVQPSKKSVGAHRYAWERVHGPIPLDLQVCHNCPGGDNPSCVNPEHLFLATADEHARDRVAKGQQVHGEDVGSAILSRADIAAIRAEPSRYGLLVNLATRYGVSQHTIWMIRAGRLWSQVTEDGTTPLGRPGRSLTDEDVELIRETPPVYGSARRLAALLGVAPSRISDVRAGRQYRRVQKDQVQLPTRPCAHCGAPITSPPSKQNKYCSMNCYNEVRRSRR